MPKYKDWESDQYFRDLIAVKRLEKTEVKKLEHDLTFKKSQEAKNKLILNSLRTVVHVAKRFVGRGLGLADLINEGNHGLTIAADKFDCSLGAGFNTYAVHWIKQRIRRAISKNSGIVHVPLYLHEKLKEAKNDEERERIELVIKRSHGVHFVDSREKEDSDLSDVIPESALPNSSFRLRVKETLKEMDDEARIMFELLSHRKDRHALRDIEIFRSYFGFEGAGKSTLKKVSIPHKKTRERIRQIISKLLRRLGESGFPSTLEEMFAFIDTRQSLHELLETYKDEA